MLEQKYHNNLYGIMFMILNGMSLAVLYAAVKILREDLDTAVIVFLYKTSILLLILPWVFASGLKAIKTPNFKLHLIRGFLSTMGSLSWAYGIKYTYVANATAILQMEPVLLVVVGVLFFAEKLSRTKLSVVIMALIGALIVIFSTDKGGGDKELNMGYFFITLAVFLYTANSSVIKVLGQKAKNKTQVFYVMLFASLFSCPFAFVNWEMVNVIGISIPKPMGYNSIFNLGLELWHFKFIAILAVCYFAHSVAFFLALRYGELAVVTPFFYSKLIASIMIGHLFLSETLQPLTLFGIYLIFVSGVILVRYENRKKRKIQKEKAIAKA